jgi:LPXTG-motif cell wall-anchored protein
MGCRNFSRLGTLVGAAFLFVLLATLAVFPADAQPPAPQLSTNATVFASGLNNPRGLKFEPDGVLYVAEGGAGGNTSAVGICEQVPPPIGPYTGGKTARISKIASNGTRTTVVDNLPSSQTSAGSGALVSGVGDVVFIGTTLYGLLTGAGCSHGILDEPNGLIRVDPDGTSVLVADLSAFVRAHPAAKPDADDFEPDGTWYSMIAVNDVVYVTEPNHQELDRITLDGQISRVIDLSTQFVPPSNWQGPTSIAYHDGNFYVGTLGTFPVRPGTQSIYKITPAGQVTVAGAGLTAVLGVAFDEQGRLYALESDTTSGLPGPTAAGSGKVVRMTASGAFEPVATGLTFPTAMTFGPDGKLYVSNFGFGLPPGMGQVVRVDVNAPLSVPPNAASPAKPARLPNTGGADFPWLALALVAFILSCAGWRLRRTRMGRG